ncbi:hypothetical protein SAMN05421844_106398 [Bosea robiniae]|uniref:HNH endonuclease n=1 Tax=Bosea robiniae TaxID=1036780 RepID=A0ABY0P3I1_9HYPH|nr:hypothetical protein SAMN05421844_106398 [Bosea robiniae]
MTKTRDDFSARTKNDLALRASYVCSLCKCPTVGPSDEGASAVTMIGVAAHFCAAAPGSGARRYDPMMTPEQRSHIDNGIWLCASCGVLIDRDEKRYTVDALRKIKRKHESSRRIGASGSDAEGDLIAIGQEIVAVGSVVRSGPDSTRVRVSHFVSGSARDLWSLNRDFERWLPERRYVLFNELGFGGLLADPAVAIASIAGGELDNVGGERRIVSATLRNLALRRSMLPQNPARQPLRHVELLDDVADAATATGGAQ